MGEVVVSQKKMPKKKEFRAASRQSGRRRTLRKWPDLSVSLFFFADFFCSPLFSTFFFAWQRRGVFIHFAFSRIGQSEIGKVFFFCFFLKKKPISSTRFHRKASRSKKKKKKKEIERPIGDGNRTRTKLGGKKKCKKKKRKKKKKTFTFAPSARAMAALVVVVVGVL